MKKVTKRFFLKYLLRDLAIRQQAAVLHDPNVVNKNLSLISIKKQTGAEFYCDILG